MAIGECMVELKQSEGGALQLGFAGDTFNTAYYARLEMPDSWAVDYYTCLGTDRMSDDMVAFMADNRIGVSSICRIAERQVGLYMIHLNNGERSFSYWRSNSAARLLAQDRARLRAAIDGADVILFSGITLAILEGDGADTLVEELGWARDAGKTVAFDPNIRPRLWRDQQEMLRVLEKGARAASMVMPSYDDETTYFGDASPEATIARYRDWGARDVILKNGEHGALIATAAGITPIAVEKVETVVDTTGAGDSFNGAFLARYALSGDAVEAAGRAARVAAAVIQHHGALVDPAVMPV
nr:sugar kinase [Rhizobium setariae]